MTAKLHTAFQTWAKWMKFGKEHALWQWNYMGVVSRLPIASPGHRPMETCHVY